MRVTICKDNGEVFAIHNLSLTQCDKVSSHVMRDALSVFGGCEAADDLMQDLRTAVNLEANGEWSEKE